MPYVYPDPPSVKLFRNRVIRPGTNRYRLHEQFVMTKHGIVYCYLKKHREPMGSQGPTNPVSPYKHPHSYFFMMEASMDGRRYARKTLRDSYDEPMRFSAYATGFTNDLARQKAVERGDATPETDMELLMQNIQLKTALRGMIDLALAWMNGPLMQKAGVSWPSPKHYPPALRESLDLLGGISQ